MGVTDEIFAAGVVGAGGAGFPTHKKLVGSVTLLIVNAVECEPLLSSDRYVMRHFADEIVGSLIDICSELGIPRVVIGTKATYTEEISALQRAIGTALGSPLSDPHSSSSLNPSLSSPLDPHMSSSRTRGSPSLDPLSDPDDPFRSSPLDLSLSSSLDLSLSSSRTRGSPSAHKWAPVIEIHTLDSFYPAGDEQMLIYEITGQTVPPGGIPLTLGIVVINVTTAYTIARALADEPVTRRFVTVNGEVAHPVIVDAPVGISPADLIAAAGGATLDSYRIVTGGPMMGHQYRIDEADFGYGKAQGGLLVLAEDSPVIVGKDKPLERVILEAKSICIQCSLCTELCPRYLIGHRMRPHRVMRSVATSTNPQDLTDALLCCECGVCELFSCPMGLSPRQMNILVKSQLRAAGVGVEDTRVHVEQTTARPYRRIAQSRFIERLRLGAYPALVTDCVVVEPDSVRIPTRHGVGKPSTPVVTVGDQVEVGQVIADVGREEVGCLVHASIPGRVTQITPTYIGIERTGR